MLVFDKWIRKLKRRYWQQYMRLEIDIHKHRLKPIVYDEFMVFDTSIDSHNLGDQIINDYCNQIFKDLGIHPSLRISTHRFPSKEEEERIKQKSLKIITGTNILSAQMTRTSIWHRPIAFKRQRECCLMGVGWLAYDGGFDSFTERFFKHCFSKRMLHSVRDSYTEARLKEAGVSNVVNTACPSMWKLTPEFCEKIPTGRGTHVITTITDYDYDQDNDCFMLDILLKLYKKVYVWIQGSKDLTYLQTYHNFSQLIVVPARLSAFDEVLDYEHIDYVGTRLHAGIRALNHQKRTLIIAIDHRANEIAKDTHLPIIQRNELKQDLEEMLVNDYETKIHLPIQNILRWKKQFLEMEIPQ